MSACVSDIREGVHFRVDAYCEASSSMCVCSSPCGFEFEVPCYFEAVLFDVVGESFVCVSV